MLSALIEAHGGQCAPGAGETEILDVQLDSRRIRSGDLFVALKGHFGDGREYIDQAVAGGARAVLMEPESRAAEPCAKPRVPLWVHAEARRVAGEAAAALQGHPSRDMRVFAITGTNGKTTTAHILGELLDHCGHSPAVVGTTGIRLARDVQLDATHTTPCAPDLQRILAQHRGLCGDSAVIEVSSHALCQARTAGLDIDFGIYTNLSHEHLDYHGSIQQYASAKSLMFSSLKHDAVAILNRDDSWFEQMADAARESGARVVTYGVRQADAKQYSAEEPVDLQASELELEPDATYLTLSGMGISLVRLRIPLSGRFNVSNALAASAAVLMSGASPSAVVAGLASVSSPRGRLERIVLPARPSGCEAGPCVYVDYAHTPDALRAVLGSLRELARPSGARVVCVFGCGGDRDPSKRALMGQVASELADVLHVTSDNPRSEDPQAIMAEIQAGIAAQREAHFEVDRRLAIRAALHSAAPGDLVLIAGKGHETVQIIGCTRQAFDDSKVAQEEWV